MKYYDPSWKRDRDHKKIVADKKRDEQIAKEVRDHFSKHPYMPTEREDKTGSFIGFGAHYTFSQREASRSRRQRRNKAAQTKPGQPTSPSKARKKGKRSKGLGATAPSVLASRSYPETRVSGPDNSTRLAAIATQLQSIEEKLEKQVVEQERTFDERRHRLLGERIGHLKAQRTKLREEQYRLS